MHQGHRERLRKKYLKSGLDNFEEHEILELLLFYAMPRKNTNPIAHDLIKTFGSIANVFDASVDKLTQVDNIGEGSAVFLNLISSVTRAYATSKNNIVNVVLDSKNAGEYVKALFYGRIYEVLYLISLDSMNRVRHTDIICQGSIDSVEINMRNIVNTVLRTNAANVILAHNHPGGSLCPSAADKDATEMIRQALSYINVKVLDHIIVRGDDYVSMATDLHWL